jgi:hypothetical protein
MSEMLGYYLGSKVVPDRNGGMYDRLVELEIRVREIERKMGEAGKVLVGE